MRELSNIDESKLLFYDIETAPLVEDLLIDTPLYKSWDYKVNKDNSLESEEVIKSFKEQAGLYPEFSRIICICTGKIIDNEIYLSTFDCDSEKDILLGFNEQIKRNSSDRLVGFANIGFDTPFIFKRMIINGIEPHHKLDSTGLKPWEVEEIDLSKVWQSTSFNRASLINIANAFGLPSPKDDISGADVSRVYWKEGVKRVSSYCRSDVVTTINVFRKMRLKTPLIVTEKCLEPSPSFILNSLFNGSEYTKDLKNALIKELKSMTKENRDKAFVILDSIVSTAKTTLTKFKKSHIIELKKIKYD